MKQQERVVVLIPVEEGDRPRLTQAYPEAEIVYVKKSQCSRELLQSANVIMGNPDLEMIADSKNLRWLQLWSAGANAYVGENGSLLPEGVVLTNATGAYGLAVSEYMLGAMMTLYKKFHLYRDQQRDGAWKHLGKVRAISGTTVLVVGLGDIGGEFASRVKALGATTIGVRRSPQPKADYMDEVHLMEDLDDLLPRADCVALVLPGTPATQGLFDARRLGLMKEGAVLINAGRGTAVDTEALCEALESGRLAGAALDVTEPEPLPADHRLWRIPTAFVTPHVSGGFSLDATYNGILNIACENLGRYAAGEPLENLVDFTTGYRASR